MKETILVNNDYLHRYEENDKIDFNFEFFLVFFFMSVTVLFIKTN